MPQESVGNDSGRTNNTNLLRAGSLFMGGTQLPSPESLKTAYEASNFGG
jgi:hypothetical protein